MKPKEAMSLAIEMAHESTSKYRLGAVLVNDKEWWSGFNKMHKTHPLGLYLLESEWIQVGVHAEMDVLIQSKGKCSRANLYVARIKRDGSWGLARPCVRCRALLLKADVKLVYFTTNNQTWGYESPIRWRQY